MSSQALVEHCSSGFGGCFVVWSVWGFLCFVCLFFNEIMQLMEGRGKSFFQASTTLPAMRCAATASVSFVQLLPIGQWHLK